MFFSKRILIWTTAALATSTVVVGTAVGVTISQNRNSEQIDETHEPNTVQPGITPQPGIERINLNVLAEKITDKTIVIKKTQEEGNEQISFIQPNTIYAFNVKAAQLGLSNTLQTDVKNVQVSFDLGLETNNVVNLNKGELSISIKLEQANLTNNNTTKTVKLTSFKKADANTDFPNLLQTDNGFVLTITPDSNNANKYIDLDSLNKQDIAVSSTSTAVTAAGGNNRNAIRAVETKKHDEEVEVDVDRGPETDPAHAAHSDGAGNVEGEGDASGVSEEPTPGGSFSAQTTSSPGTTAGSNSEQEQPQLQTTTALTNWLNTDSTKAKHTKGIKVEGLVKLEKISGDNSSSKAYFHLVSKDTSNRIKLVKVEGDTTKEILLSEIKTTNLLASDVTIKPTTINEAKQVDYINALKQIKNADEDEEMHKQYLIDNVDESLNRELSVDLGSKNILFVKPFVTDWPTAQQTSLPLSLTVSFGSGENVSSFSTSNEEQLKQLQAAGFKFGLFTKKLMGHNEHTDATVFDTKKEQLSMFFKMQHYTTASNRPQMNMQKYPSDFTLKEVMGNDLATNLNVMLDNTNLMESQNWLAFADYSYKGMSENMVLYSPVISLIKVDKNTIVS